MPKIQILDERTANQIAAGEVVERPASVVKELVENSLDAGATSISVEVEGGGARLCRVTDNGCGMSPEDALLALERHATSKISTATDLFRVMTMGFRGEALPSIASVSRLELVTREPGSLSGVRLMVEGGRLSENAPTGCPEGARITVRDLFYNTPARLKYLKSASTESAQVADTVTRLALAHPEVAFRLTSGGQVVLSTPGSGKVIDAIACAFGAEVARQLLALDYRDQSVAVHGFVGCPAVSRAGRTHQFIFINRRPVRSLPLRYALEEAYHHLLPVQRYPVAVLFLEIDPSQVDVNVHPAKLEVRFEREREIRAAVHRAVRQELQKANLVPDVSPRVSSSGEQPVAPGAAATRSPAATCRPSTAWSPAAIGHPSASWSPADTWSRKPEPGYNTQQMTAFWQETPVGYDARTLAPADKSLTPTEASDQPALAAHSDLAAAPDLAARLKALRPLGQIHRSYIVADSPEGLCIIDQHAAHERIFYERLLFTASPEKPQVQPLLFPVTMDLAPAQMAVWEDHRELLATAGFVIEPFGGKTLLVHGIPMALGETMAAPIVLDLIERLLYTESSGTNPTDPIAKRSEILAALAACKAAIKARESLTGEEMSALIAQLAACRSPATCPHGRPTMIAISVSELEKQFKRT